jgi:putative ABC transport system permease protein
VDAVARVGVYPATLVIGNQTLNGQVMGVDRGAMAAVTRYRDDYSTVPVADLFNQLAGNRTGVLLNRSTAEQYTIGIGQSVTLRVTALSTTYETRVPVMGYVDFFPTLDPADGFFIITNIDPLFELVGTTLPYDVWLSLEPDADRNVVYSAIQALNFPILEWQDPATELIIAQAEPARRGVLGFLSVGFAAAIVLTLIAAVIQNVSSFRAQSSQLGALRAMGLGDIATGTYMVLVQSITASSSILVGTGIGVLTTVLFLPLLDFSGGLPPYLVRVAWDELLWVYVLFAGTLFGLTLLLTTLLSREQITAIVKLGE